MKRSTRGVAKSTTSASRTSQKRKQTTATNSRKKVNVDDRYYAKRLLDKRLKGGELQYLVDWEDDSNTGEVFEPTWEPAHDCGEGLVSIFNESQTGSQEQNDEPSQDSIPESSPTSPPVKRRKIAVDIPAATPQEEPPAKKSRTAGTVESARFQSVSQENLEAEELPREIKDSYEEETQNTEIQNTAEHITATAQVQLVVPEDFDRSAYIVCQSSQELSSQAQATEDVEQSTSNTPAPSNRRPFIWDEELTPLGDSSSYQVPATASLNTGTTATQQDETESGDPLQESHGKSEVEAEDTSPDYTIEDSLVTEQILSQLEEAQADHTESSYVQGTTPTSSSENQLIVQNSSEQVLVQSVQSTQFAQASEFTIHSSSLVANIPIIPDQSATVTVDSSNTEGLDQFNIEDFIVVPEREQGPPVDQSDLHTESIVSQPAAFRPNEDSQNKDQSSSSQFQTQITPQHWRESARLEFSQHAQIVEQSSQSLENEAHPFSSSLRASTLPRSSQIHRSFSNSNPVDNSPQASSAPAREPTPTATPTKKSSYQPSNPLTPVNRVSRSPSVALFNMEPTPTKAPYDPFVLINAENAKLKAQQAEKAAARRARSVFSGSPAPKPVPVVSSPQTSMLAPTSLPPAVSMPSPMPALSPSTLSESGIIQSQQLPILSPILPIFTPDTDLPLAAPISPPRITPDVFSEDVEETSEISYLKVVNQSQGEFLIPLPLNTQTRDIYYQTIRNYKSQSRTFLTDEVFSPSLVQEIDNMFVKLSKLCDHQDLGNDNFSTQRQDSPDVQARWAENVSTKCIFLVEFLLELQRLESVQHVVVLVRPGRLIEILEAICISHKFVYNMAGGQVWSSNVDKLKVTLYPTDVEFYDTSLTASVVIAFDSTAKSVSNINNIRVKTISGELAPLFSLVVYNSIEHLERCFPADTEEIRRKIKLVSYLHHIDENVGKLDMEDYQDPESAAKLAARYAVNNDGPGQWLLGPMPGIRTIDSSSSDGTQDRDGTEPLSIASQFGTKRRSETMMSIDSPKRQKVSEITSQAQSKTATPIIVEEQQDNDPVSLLQRITDLEARLRKQEETSNDLRQINRDLESQCRDYESSIRAIQPKYQEALNERGQFEHQRKLAEEREARMLRLHDKKDLELRRVQAHKDIVDAELEGTRNALNTAFSTSDNALIVELGALKAEKEGFVREIEALRQRNTNLSKELDFVRSEYQKGSGTAAELSNELGQARELNAQLREQADGNRVKVHEIQRENEGRYYRNVIQGLESEKADLIRLNEKLDKDLRAMQVARRGMRERGASPMVGGSGMGGVGSPRGVARVMQDGNGNGSRSGSPVVGERVNRTFGEALFQGNARGAL